MDKNKQYELYANLLIEWNKFMNLTAIDDREEIYIRHFNDCQSLVKHMLPNQLVADIGSGAGFPGIVLAIECPLVNFVLVEPLLKRTKFLLEVIKVLGLNNVQVLNKRAEDLEFREHFDVTVARAVSKTSILCELMAPLLKVNGKLMLMKGPRAQEELIEAKNAFKVLDLELETIDYYSLSNSDIVLGNVIIKKNKKTNMKYPRSYGQIKKKPL